MESKITEKILEVFRKNAGNYVSGEDISRALKISRAYVWKYITKLRDDGYEIDAVPHLGYRLRSAPDKLYPVEIKLGLNTKVIGQKEIFHYDAIGSTNEKAYELAESGVPEGTIVAAEEQSRGKGRMGRVWASPRGGGIYVSLVLRPDVEMDEIPTITLIAASSIARAIKKVSGVDAGVKWPNDLFVNGKKVSGILTEIKAQPDNVDFLVLGIGINVNTPAGKLPHTATSLKTETSSPWDRVELLRVTLEEIEKDYEEFKKNGFPALRDECKKRSILLGRKVEISEHKKVIKGTVSDIDEKGVLIVEDAKGGLKRVFAGDVVLCR